MTCALLLDSHHDRPASHLGVRDIGSPGDHDVRVRIEAVALNPLDAKIATGAMTDWFPVAFPYVPGTDFAGTVEAVGADVGDLSPGDAVFGRADPGHGGAIAERIIIAADRVAHRPQTLSAAEAACLPTPAGIAWQVLDMMARRADEPLLILGDGAVARMASAIVGPAARRAVGMDELPEVGELRYVLDAIGGPVRDAVLAMLPKGAHLISITAPANATLAAERGVRTDFAVLATSRAQLDALAGLADRGVLRPRIDHLVPVADAATFFDRYVARDLAGKIVINLSGR